MPLGESSVSFREYAINCAGTAPFEPVFVHGLKANTPKRTDLGCPSLGSLIDSAGHRGCDRLRFQEGEVISVVGNLPTGGVEGGRLLSVVHKHHDNAFGA